MIVTRYCKIALVAAIALFFSLVAYGNLTYYASNWQFVRHVLSMDTTFQGSAIHGRAITNLVLQEALYDAIIATQLVVSAILWVGCLRMLIGVRKSEFHKTQALAVLGLTAGLLLYITGFITIGGEWFAMWQSTIWNGQQKAFEFTSMLLGVLIVVLLPEKPDLE